MAYYSIFVLVLLTKIEGLKRERKSEFGGGNRHLSYNQQTKL